MQRVSFQDLRPEQARVLQHPSHDSPNVYRRREGIAVKTCSRGPEACPRQRLERRPFTDIVLSLEVWSGATQNEVEG